MNGLLSPRTLPIRVPIADGESMHSWLEALARRYCISVRELLPALGLESPRRAYGLINGLDRPTLRLIERQAGMDVGRLEHAVLDRFAPLGLSDRARQGPPYRRWERWARASGSNFCPRCLAESGGRWSLSWHLIWSFACTRHEIVLASRCGSCNQVPRSGENRFDHVIDGCRCCHATRANPRTRSGPGVPRCHALLTEQRVEELTAHHPLLRSQMWIDRIVSACLDGDRQITMAGLAVSPDVAFAAVAALVRHVLIQDVDISACRVKHVARGPAGKNLRLPDRDLCRPAADTYGVAVRQPALFGVAAALAVDVLAAPSLQAAVETMRWMGFGPVHPAKDGVAKVSLLDTAETGSPLVDAIVLRARAPNLSAAYRLSYRTENAVPRRPAGSSRAAGAEEWPFLPRRLTSLPARLVPQAVWRSVADKLPSHVSQDTTAFRSAVAMALVRCGTFTEWAHIAVQLMLPRQLANTITSVWRDLAQAGCLVEVLAAIDSLVDALTERPPPIDYARRRWVFRDLEPVTASRLRAACHDAGLVATGRRRRFATMLLWETLTGGDIRLQDGDLVPRDAPDRFEYARFCKREAVHLTDYLAIESERLLLRHRIDEPVSWEPQFNGPDGPQWRSPPPDMTRLLPGWVSPSRLGTLRRSARDHTPAWRSLIDDENFCTLNALAGNLQALASVRVSHPADLNIDDVLEIQADYNVTLIDRHEPNWLPTDDGLSFMKYWTTAQPLRPYSWVNCPWAWIGHEYQHSRGPRYWISQQNLDLVTAFRIHSARHRIAQRALEAAEGSERIESVDLELQNTGDQAEVATLVISRSSSLEEEVSTYSSDSRKLVQSDASADPPSALSDQDSVACARSA